MRFNLIEDDIAFHLLSDSPLLGNTCDFIINGYRKVPVSSHIIYYHRKGQAQIEIVRILHKRMDAKTEQKAHNANHNSVVSLAVFVRLNPLKVSRLLVESPSFVKHLLPDVFGH